MVSKASDDLPEPERPVNTTSRSLGIDRVTFLRLCSRAPRIVIWSVGIRSLSYSFFSCDRKRGAGGGDQAPSTALDAALRDHRALPGVDDTAGGPQRLSDLGGGDEAQLEIKAHRSRDAGLDGAQRAAHRRVGQEVDLQLDGRVPDAFFLKRGERHAHRGVGDLRDHAALHDPATVPMLWPRLQLEDHTARLRFGDTRADRLHPASGLGGQEGGGSIRVLDGQGPRRVFRQFRTVVLCLGAAAIASDTSSSSSLSPVSSPASLLRSRMMRSRTLAASSNCSSLESRRISFSRSRTMARMSSRGTPAPIISSTASAWRSFLLISSA